MRTTYGPTATQTIAIRAAVGIDLVIGILGLVGGLLLIASPNGTALGMSTAPLSGSPFTDYTIPGIVLAFLIGIGFISIAMITWERLEHVPEITLSAALILIVWLGVQAAIVGVQWQQLPVALLALGLVVLSGWLPESRRPRVVKR